MGVGLVDHGGPPSSGGGGFPGPSHRRHCSECLLASMTPQLHVYAVSSSFEKILLYLLLLPRDLHVY